MKPASKKLSPAAFTLIELLVAIAIIAILIALLIPTLSRARETSRRSVCAANLRTIAMTINLYAEDNIDKYPPFDRSMTNPLSQFNFTWGFSQQYYQPWTTFTAYFPPPARTSPVNLGLLHELGMIDPRVFYCPSATWFEWQYPKPDTWKKAKPLLATDRMIMTGYMYNPHVNSTGGDYPKYRGKRVDFPRDKTIVIDMIENWRKFEDISHRPPQAGWNLAYMDAHVELRNSQTAVNKIRTGDPNSWSDMNVILNALQDQ